MATSYPGGLDSFTNPTATDSLNSATVPHATQHANANDAIEAIQAELGTDPAGASLTVKARFEAIEANGWVTSTRILDGTIVDGDINAAAAIDPTKINGTAVVDSDARLSDARTPTAHAASHESGGGDEIEIAQSQVTDLTTDLAGKADSAATTASLNGKAPRTALYLPGTSGNNVSCPDSAAVSITGDIDLRAYVRLTDWTPGTLTTLISKNDASGPQYSYFFAVTNATGVLRFIWSPNGATASALDKSSTVATGLTDGTAKWVRVTLDVDNGATQNEVKFYMADDDGTGNPGTWTQLGATVATAGTTSIHDGTTALSVGARASDGGLPLTGDVMRAQVYNGIGGSLVADYRSDAPMGTRYIDSLGNLWTINGSAWAWKVMP